MMSDTRNKPFDCVTWTRQRRDQMYQESKDMTPEERARRSRRPMDPFLAKLFDRAKPPVGGPRRSQGMETANSTADAARTTAS